MKIDSDDDVTFYGEGLSADAVRVLQEVTGKMRPWIEKNVAALCDTVRTEADVKLKELQTSMKEADVYIQEINVKLAGLEAALDGVLKAPDGDKVKRIQELAVTVVLARQDLVARQEKMQALGKTVTNAIIKAGAAAVGVPPQLV